MVQQLLCQQPNPLISGYCRCHKGDNQFHNLAIVIFATWIIIATAAHFQKDIHGIYTFIKRSIIDSDTGTVFAPLHHHGYRGEIRRVNTNITDGKITWGALLEAAKAAGIKQDDPIDTIDIAWGDANGLCCIKDEDFGWQISLCEEREDERYAETD